MYFPEEFDSLNSIVRISTFDQLFISCQIISQAKKRRLGLVLDSSKEKFLFRSVCVCIQTSDVHVIIYHFSTNTYVESGFHLDK